MGEHVRAHADKIRGWVDEGGHGPKLARLVLRTTGVPVPLRTLQRFVAEDLGVETGQGEGGQFSVSPGDQFSVSPHTRHPGCGAFGCRTSPRMCGAAGDVCVVAALSPPLPVERRA